VRDLANAAVRAAFAAVLKEQGSEEPDLYSPVNSESAQMAEPLYSPVNSTNAAAGKEAAQPVAAEKGTGERLYSPVNSLPPATEAALDRAIAAASSPVGSQDTVLARRRRELMAGVAPGALTAAVLQPIDPRSCVTDQTWLASMLAGEEPFPKKKRMAA